MAINYPFARQCLRNFDFPQLFIEELGWDHYRARPLEIGVDGTTHYLDALAEKRGFAAFLCRPDSEGRIPDYATRRKIERLVAKSIHEHLIIYCDAARTTQTWQWVKRELGKPVACREHTYHRDQPGDSLIQKLQAITFTLEEEESLTIIEVAARVRQGFYADRVTKRFYDRFKTEHDGFLRFIRGIPDEEMKRWYASVMLNRLMFIYFIQKKGFLGGDQNYLGQKLAQSQTKRGDLFYQEVLCPLFFEGFAKREEDRDPAINQLLGQVPYLNGGIFTRHQVEELHHQEIQIPDSAFAGIFAFFDAYHWHLDERPLRADNEINPDVLGYIFEKYINQKQMGAYYTKEDITEYIAKNTIIPFLVDAAHQKCAIAFKEDAAVWRLLRDDPDRYLYEAVCRGVDLKLPEDIAAGIADVSKRGGWNRPAAPELALPTETWREHVARRQRCLDLREKLRNGEVHAVNDLVTYNLDLRQFAQDVIENCEGPELLRAFYHAIEKVTVLDPTCGSGAFLFAALNILEPLYDACLERMQAFLEELDRAPTRPHPEKFSDFRKILARLELHPNHRYFILKSIMINNLYGVDLMHEAVEICKLRLFLKLVAQVERVEQMEPLPDIDFNIRAGNTLVGFATQADVRRALVSSQTGQARLAFGEEQDALARIDEAAEVCDGAFKKFREMQTEHGMDAREFAAAKEELRRRLAVLAGELDRYLANEYGINQNTFPKKKEYERKFENWQASHQPFHWFSEFYGIMKSGGFDVIIGNPPYVEYRTVRNTYRLPQGQYLSEPAENLYAYCMERSCRLLKPSGWFGMIVPTGVLGLDESVLLRNVLLKRYGQNWCSTYAIRPSKLFDGVDQRLCVYVGTQNKNVVQCILTTRYHHWNAEERPVLFSRIEYASSFLHDRLKRIPQVGSPEATSVLQKFGA